MTAALPPLPKQAELGDWCRETADVEKVQPWTVEKDFFLTRIIWALAQVRSDALLLKGGTCLSKVDVGYHRMSEDIDMTIPGTPTRYSSTNSNLVNDVVRSIQAIADVVGVRLANFDGERFEKGAHAIWEVGYSSEFLPPKSAVISVEVSIRPTYRDARRPALQQLLPAALATGYEEAFCWALDFAEVRAEKVRAAYTREQPQIRDFYDLGLLASLGVDMSSDQFRKLVDTKLGELNAEPLAEQPASFGLTPAKRKAVEESKPLLEGVLRADEPPFELQPVLDHYNKLWAKTE